MPVLFVGHGSPMNVIEEEPPVIEPVDPLEGRQLEGIQAIGSVS